MMKTIVIKKMTADRCFFSFLINLSKAKLIVMVTNSALEEKMYKIVAYLYQLFALTIAIESE